MNIMFLLTNRNVGLSVYTWWSWYTWDGIVDNVVLTVYHLKFTNFQEISPNTNAHCLFTRRVNINYRSLR